MLGPEQGRPARRRHPSRRLGAAAGRSRRRVDRRGRGRRPHLRAGQRRAGVVLGRQPLPPARCRTGRGEHRPRPGERRPAAHRPHRGVDARLRALRLRADVLGQQRGGSAGHRRRADPDGGPHAVDRRPAPAERRRTPGPRGAAAVAGRADPARDRRPPGGVGGRAQEEGPVHDQGHDVQPARQPAHHGRPATRPDWAPGRVRSEWAVLADRGPRRLAHRGPGDPAGPGGLPRRRDRRPVRHLARDLARLRGRPAVGDVAQVRLDGGLEGHHHHPVHADPAAAAAGRPAASPRERAGRST